MAIRPNFDIRAIERYIKEETEKTEKAFIRALNYIGEKAVIEARRSQQYKDRTGNLRNSTGYVVVKDGQIINSVFDQNHNANRGYPGRKNGKAVGRALALQLAGNFPKGLALIVVAGMKYASYVESKGRNVLTSSERLAQREVPRILNEIVRG